MNFCYAFLNVLFLLFFFPGEKDTTHSMFFDALPRGEDLDFGGYIVWSQHVDAVKYIVTVL